MMMRNVASQSYGWDQFCADPASFVDECLADPACSKCVALEWLLQLRLWLAGITACSAWALG